MNRPGRGWGSNVDGVLDAKPPRKFNRDLGTRLWLKGFFRHVTKMDKWGGLGSVGTWGKTKEESLYHNVQWFCLDNVHSRLKTVSTRLLETRSVDWKTGPKEETVHDGFGRGRGGSGGCSYVALMYVRRTSSPGHPWHSRSHSFRVRGRDREDYVIVQSLCVPTWSVLLFSCLGVSWQVRSVNETCSVFKSNQRLRIFYSWYVK